MRAKVALNLFNLITLDLSAVTYVNFRKICSYGKSAHFVHYLNRKNCRISKNLRLRKVNNRVIHNHNPDVREFN